LAWGQVANLPGGVDVDRFVTEAAARFAIPEPWIRNVMGAESAFRVRAVSRAGAMGLMQLMPQTYAELRARYGLGPDPFGPRDNILAGAAYLREMYDRYGAPGFLAAYNAGPARYEQHLIFGRRLPGETQAYVADLAPRISGETVARAAAEPPRPSLFVALAPPTEAPAADRSGIPPAAPVMHGDGLFARLTPMSEAR
jgi:hypothetical protein